MAAPNVIPMADIMLVLLIIFMVVTPMLQHGQNVNWPALIVRKICRTPTRMTRSLWLSIAKGKSTLAPRRLRKISLRP